MKALHPNQEALNLKKEIAKVDRKISSLNVQFVCLHHQLRDVCIHDDTELKHEYQAGGYLERSVYINKVVCKVCGKVIKEERITGSFE